MSKTLLALGAIAVAATAVALYWNGAADAPIAVDPADRNGANEGRTASGEVEVAKSTATREAVVAAAEPNDDWLAHPYVLKLAVRLVDPQGLPVAGRTLRLAPHGCTLDDATKDTDADGKVVLEWPSRRPSGSIVIADPLGYFRRYELQHGVERAVTFGGRSDAAAGLRLSGSNISFRVMGSGGGSGSPVVLSGLPFVRDFAQPDGRSDRLHPFAIFATNAAQARPTAQPQVVETSSSMTFSLDGLKFGNADEKAAPTAPSLTVSGIVYGEDGNALADVPVQLFGSDPKPTASGATDANGAFRFEKLAAGDYSVRAGGDRAGLGIAKVSVAAGTATTAVYLRRELCVGGRVTEADGKPLGKARLQWIAADGTWWDQTTTDQDGTFVFANLPDARGTVLLLPTWRQAELPIATGTSVLADGGGVVLHVDPAALGRLQFELPPWANDAGGDIGVRLWNEDLGLGINLRRGDKDTGNRWLAKDLVSGWYRLEVFVPGQGCVDLGKQWLEPGGNLDLGILKLPNPCTVELRFGPEPSPMPTNDVAPPPQTEAPRLELYAIRDDLDVRLRVAELTDRCDLRLPPGDYALARQETGKAVEWHRLSTRRGETVRLPAGK
ncbi:MAG: Carboxypeptidase regulatory-like domain [Planctomycetota bacterium]|jgi:hypothetical protein